MNRTVRIGALACAATLTALLTATACGGPTAGDGPASSAPAAAAAGARNDADATFVRGMVPHHRQAVEMAALAATNTTDPTILALAGRIQQAQAPEIETMNGFLISWGMAPTSSDSMGGMDHGSTGGMPDASMQQLRQARGAAFDRMFLTMMVEHHNGAVTMARAEIASGRDARAKALAQQIIDAQQAEMAEMTTLLAAS